MKPTLTAVLLTGTLLAGPALAVEQADVVKTYADIAAAGYADSLTSAQSLQGAIDALIATPSDETLTRPWTGVAVRGSRSLEEFRQTDPQLNQHIQHMMDVPVEPVLAAALKLYKRTTPPAPEPTHG